MASKLAREIEQESLDAIDEAIRDAEVACHDMAGAMDRRQAYESREQLSQKLRSIIDAKLRPVHRMIEGYRDFVNRPGCKLDSEIVEMLALLAEETWRKRDRVLIAALARNVAALEHRVRPEPRAINLTAASYVSLTDAEVWNMLVQHDDAVRHTLDYEPPITREQAINLLLKIGAEPAYPSAAPTPKTRGEEAKR